MNQAMETTLIVVHPFAAYRKGDIISDAALVASILASGRAASVIRTTVPASASAGKKEA